MSADKSDDEVMAILTLTLGRDGHLHIAYSRSPEVTRAADTTIVMGMLARATKVVMLQDHTVKEPS